MFQKVFKSFHSSQQRSSCVKSEIETLRKVQNIFKVNKDIKTTSMALLWCLSCQLLVYLISLSSAFYDWLRTGNCLLGHKHLLNGRSSTHVQVWICLPRLIRHKIQKVKNMDTSILTSALNFARELWVRTVF